MRSEVKAGEFYHSKHFRTVAKVIEIERLWGHDYVRIWLPNPDALVRVPVADLSPINSQSLALSSDHIAYVAAAAKVANVLGDDFGTLKRLASGNERRNSVWTMFDQVIVSFDSVKPMTGRRGWTDERVDEYNRARFEDLITAGWDLVIFNPDVHKWLP